MLLDLLTPDNQVSFNVEVARRFGLEASVYLSQLIEISAKAKRKKKLVDGKFFIIDREYIEKRTTLNKNAQQTIENRLSDINIILKGDTEDSLYVDIDLLASSFMDDDESFTKDVRTHMKVNKDEMKSKKSYYQLVNTKKAITTTDPDLRLAWEAWLEMVAEKYDFVGKRLLHAAEKEVDTYATTPQGRDFYRALDVINYATDYGYMKMSNAIDAFEKSAQKKNLAQSTVHSSDITDEIILSGEEF